MEPATTFRGSKIRDVWWIFGVLQRVPNSKINGDSSRWQPLAAIKMRSKFNDWRPGGKFEP